MHLPCKNSEKIRFYHVVSLEILSWNVVFIIGPTILPTPHHCSRRPGGCGVNPVQGCNNVLYRNAARICVPTFWEWAQSVMSQFLYWILFPFGFRYSYSQCRSIYCWEIVIINIDPTNHILWKSKVTSYSAEFHKYVKYFTLWFLCRNWCVSPRQTSFYDKVKLRPIGLNSTIVDKYK